mmetsp:Transcript_5816/g.26183  ORF Transcript_5816/g.26183 Transcript_5816/m.26183 type:complete len:249 (-) Transcript_5816:27-773(-)
MCSATAVVPLYSTSSPSMLFSSTSTPRNAASRARLGFSMSVARECLSAMSRAGSRSLTYRDTRWPTGPWPSKTPRNPPLEEANPFGRAQYASWFTHGSFASPFAAPITLLPEMVTQPTAMSSGGMPSLSTSHMSFSVPGFRASSISMILSSMSRLVAVFRGDAPPGMELLECSNGRFFSSTEGSASSREETDAVPLLTDCSRGVVAVEETTGVDDPHPMRATDWGRDATTSVNSSLQKPKGPKCGGRY